jgi:uncharacterized membrane protein YjjP (DUF1212 family)
MSPDFASSPGSPHPDSQEAEFRSHVELLAALAKGLHSSGVPAHRLETTLEQTALRLGTPVHVFSLPTGVMLSVGPETSGVAMLLRIDPSGVHLERLAQLTVIARALGRGTLEAPEAKRRIDFVMRAGARWGRGATLLSYVLSAGAFAVFFGGGLVEIVTAVCIGLAVGAIAVAMQRVRSSTRVFELASAAAAGAIANAAHLVAGHFVEWIPFASGLIILLPGLALVDAVDELAHGHLSSGAARLAGVVVVLLVMAFGAVVGVVLVEEAGSVVDAPSAESPLWWMAPALVAVAGGSMIRFRARWRDFSEALVGSALALVGAKLGAYWLGAIAGPFFAGLLLGAVGNASAAIFRQPAQLVTVPGLALLVPGSFGVQSLDALLSDNTAVGVDTAFHMFLVAMALVSGLLISNSFFRDVHGYFPRTERT